MNALLTGPGSIAARDRASETLATSSTSPAGFPGENESPPIEEEEFPSNSHFREYFRLFAEIHAIGDMSKVFPKPCRVCGRHFDTFAEYLRETQPKEHVFEDCQEVMNKPFTMVYRHCLCGNTLVMTLTAEIFPPLVRFWSMLRQEAEGSGRSLVAVVRDFSEQCDRYILDGDDCRPNKANP